MEIWMRSADLSESLFELADQLERKRKFRWAEQLRAAVLSVTNNIAEGSGSASNAEFAQFLNIARRSVFESANIVMMLQRRRLLSSDADPLLDELQEVSRMIFSFRRSL